MVKVSVIVPCYNAGAFLEAAIESVLAQDMEDWELILIDDGSKDATPEIIQRYSLRDPRIRGFSQANSGRATACDRGTALCSAESQYIFYLDNDDLLTPYTLRFMSDYLDLHPEVGLLGCQLEMIDGEGRPLGPGKTNRWVPGRIWPRKLSDSEEETPFVTFFCGNAPGPFAMHRRSVFQQTTGWEKRLSPFSVHDDTDMFCQMALWSKVLFLPDKLYIKRIHPASGVHQFDRVQNSYTVFRDKWDHYEAHNPAQQEVVRKALKHYYSRHKPFRDLNVAKMAAASLLREPSMFGLRWFIHLVTSALQRLVGLKREK